MRRKLDWGLAAGGLVAIISAALLGAGLFTILSAVAQDGVHLPSEGSLEEVLGDGVDGGEDDTRDDASRLGLDLDDPGPADAFPTSSRAEPLRTTATPSPAPSPAPTPTPSPTPTPTPTPPPPAPVAIVIPRLEVAAPVVAMGLNADRYPEVPDAPDLVAWYTFSAAPGQSSNAVFAAHLDWANEYGEAMGAVFYRLSELQIDDIITLALEDGAELEYRVTGNVAIPYDDPNVIRLMEATAEDVITLFTCGGTWELVPDAPYGGNYSHRIVVRAERIPPPGDDH